MKSRAWDRGLRNTALILVGILLGAAIAPSTAHVTKRIKHLRKHLNPHYVNEGQEAGGDLIGSYPAPVIAPGAVGANEIADDAVTEDKIAANAVVSSKVAPNSLTDQDLAANSVNSFQVQDNSLSAQELGQNSVGSGELRVLNVESASTAPFGSGQTGQNGSYITRAVTVRCPAGNIALSGGGQWSVDANDLELVIQSSHWVAPSGADGPGWRVRGGVDQDDDFTLTATVLCLPAGL